MRLPVTEKLRLYWKWLEIGSGTTDDGTKDEHAALNQNSDNATGPLDRT